MNLKRNPETYKRTIDNTYNTPAEAFEEGKDAQLQACQKAHDEYLEKYRKEVKQEIVTHLDKTFGYDYSGLRTDEILKL